MSDVEEILECLDRSIANGHWFEISNEDAVILRDHIRRLSPQQPATLAERYTQSGDNYRGLHEQQSTAQVDPRWFKVMDGREVVAVCSGNEHQGEVHSFNTGQLTCYCGKLRLGASQKPACSRCGDTGSWVRQGVVVFGKPCPECGKAATANTR